MEFVGKETEIEILLLAAGISSRMLGADKLLLEFEGEKILRRTAKEALKSKAGSVKVILGHNSQKRAQVLIGLEVEHIICRNFDEGISASIQAGLKNIKGSVEAVIIALADMPLVSYQDFNQLIDKFSRSTKSRIFRAISQNGKVGHPVLFPKSAFSLLTSLVGDCGAKHILKSSQIQTEEVKTRGESAVTDIDSYADWESLKKEVGSHT